MRFPAIYFFLGRVFSNGPPSFKVFIEAIVNDMWIWDLCNPKTFYSNVTALAIFDHLCKHSGSLHALDMVFLTIQISQYYEGMSDIPEYISLLEDAQQQAARACLLVTNQTLTVLASTALLAAVTLPCTTELWTLPTRPGLPGRQPTLLPTRRGPTTSVPLEGLTT